MQTFVMFLLIIASVVLMVFAISKLKMHPFIVMLVIAMLLGLCWGLYQPGTAGLETPADMVTTIKNGFGGIMTSIGIVILCGTIIGTILEKTGASSATISRVRRSMLDNGAGGVMQQVIAREGLHETGGES